MIRDGKLFVIEGPDGSGKTTMVSHLISRLHGDNITIEEVALPNPKCCLYKKIRDYLCKKKIIIDDLQSMMILNMDDCFENIIVPKLEHGINIILDRWAISTIVYNTAKRGKLIKEVFLTKDNEIDLEKIVRYTSRSKWPDRIFYLNTPLDIILDNAKKRNSDEQFDKKDNVIKVYDTYQEFYRAITNKKYKFNERYLYEFEMSTAKNRHNIIDPDYLCPIFDNIYTSMEDKVYLEILNEIKGASS